MNEKLTENKVSINARQLSSTVSRFFRAAFFKPAVSARGAFEKVVINVAK